MSTSQKKKKIPTFLSGQIYLKKKKKSFFKIIIKHNKTIVKRTLKRILFWFHLACYSSSRNFALKIRVS